MRHRSEVAAATLGALATLLLAMPLVPLFESARWVPGAMLGVAVLLGTGVVLRGVTGSAGLTILGQLLSGTAYVLATQLGSSTVRGVLPTSRTWPLASELFRDAQETITTYAAPAPETPGVTIVLVVIVMVVALAVDMSAATAGSPTIAGLPLLSLFLVSAANSGGALPWVWFVGGAALWLAMLAHQSERDLREWTTAIPLMGSADGAGVAERAMNWQAARLTAVCLAAAVLVPALLPHMPTRYVLDGLGDGGAGSGRSTDGIRLSTELDLQRSLASPSQEPVLRYTTDDPTPQPLRVAVVTDFDGGFGRMRSTAPRPDGDTTLPPAGTEAAEGVARDERSLRVESNGVAAPQIAMPSDLTSIDTGGIPLAIGPDDTARVQRTPSSYTARFVELDPEEADFTAAPDTVVDPAAEADAYSDDHLALDPASAEAIQQLALSLAPEGGGDLAAAQAFQRHLRGSDFEYSLDLPTPADGPSDPILSFLETKVGYCQQFASTMTLLARAQGIPARVVVGFLPGEASGTDERVVRASDAHAWPELYFRGVGWTRFEPTPGARAASVPSYSIAIDRGNLEPTEETASETTTPTTTAPALPEADAPSPAEEEDTTRAWPRVLLTLLLAGAALALMPVTAWVTRRRERTRAAGAAERTEVEWQDFLDRLDDLGLPAPRGATPRSVGTWLARRGHLEPASVEQLDHVVATVERARYGRPEQSLPDIGDPTDAIVEEVRGQRLPSARLRARLWPRAGVEAWLAAPQRVADRIRRITQSR